MEIDRCYEHLQPINSFVQVKNETLPGFNNVYCIDNSVFIYPMSSHQLTLFLVSNMYPSARLPRFGIFVRHFEERIRARGISIPYRCVLTDTKHINKLKKAIKYLGFLTSIITKGIKHRKHYHLIYLHYPVHTVLPVYILHLITGKKVILNFHGNDLMHSSFLKRLIKPYLLRLAKCSAALVVPSNYFKSQLVNILPINPDKVIVYPSSGVDTSLFRPFSQNQKNETRRALSIPPEVHLVGYISTIKPSKGWRTFVKAFETLINERNDSFALIVGDGPYAEELETFVQEKKLSQQLNIIKSVHHEQLVKYYNALDVMVFPTKGESLGLVGLEAMACGIPIIATNSTAPKDYVKHGQNGFLFEIGNEKELKDKILEFIELDINTKRGMSQKARQTAMSYDASIVNDKMARELKEILKP